MSKRGQAFLFLAIAFMAVAGLGLRRDVARLEYRVAVLEGQVAALQNDESDAALAMVQPAIVREQITQHPHPSLSRETAGEGQTRTEQN
jgi:hypothetical protein